MIVVVMIAAAAACGLWLLCRVLGCCGAGSSGSCTQCGARVRANAKFCGKCGAKIET